MLQIFSLLLQIFALLQVVALLQQIFAPLFGINCTEIDQSQSSIISVYILIILIMKTRYILICSSHNRKNIVSLFRSLLASADT